MTGNLYDVMIVGSGPAGAAAAIALGGTSLSVALTDKASFPRDKTCGDALSVDVINQLGKLSPALAGRFETTIPKVASRGVRIVAPNGNAIDIPFITHGSRRSGFVCRRRDFDALLVQEAKQKPNVTFLENCDVSDINVLPDHVSVRTNQGLMKARMIIGADGAHSLVRRKLATSVIDPHCHSAGLRMYHQQVGGFQEGNFIELYFFRDILPGYLWVFPLPDGDANVGIGMLSAAISARKVNLKRVLQQLLSDHPLLKERFRHAVSTELPKGHGLPLGGGNRTISGSRFLLAGDAASLIDPFSGEGIGNAIRSGRFAAQQVLQSFSKNDFTAPQMRNYDVALRQMLHSEFLVSNGLLRLCRFPFLFNTVVDKANRNPALHQTLIDALANPGKKLWLTSPSFYLNLLFR